MFKHDIYIYKCIDSMVYLPRNERFLFLMGRSNNSLRFLILSQSKKGGSRSGILGLRELVGRESLPASP